MQVYSFIPIICPLRHLHFINLHFMYQFSYCIHRSASGMFLFLLIVCYSGNCYCKEILPWLFMFQVRDLVASHSTASGWLSIPYNAAGMHHSVRTQKLQQLFLHCEKPACSRLGCQPDSCTLQRTTLYKELYSKAYRNGDLSWKTS